MHNLETKIAKLEKSTHGGRVITAWLYDGESNEDALALAGIKPDPQDLVIFIRRFRDRDGA